MRIVVAIDSFKGSLSSLEAGRAAGIGIRRADSAAGVEIFPLADGGEGTCRTLTEGLGGEIKSVEVTGALGDRIRADFGEIGALAVIEMASAAGLNLVPENLRNPLNTTTFGVGEMILRAARDGCKNFVIGIGGSATNDCGLGMLNALGFKFFDADGKICGIFGRNLADVRRIDTSEVAAEIGGCAFRIACDVRNPLTGANGCSAVYAPQKGATAEIVAQMDSWIKNFSELAAAALNVENNSVAGDGAAGGLGYAFRNFLGGELVPGVELILDALNISAALREADVLITGEGSIDAQTLQGKAPVGVARLARRLNPRIKIVAIGGGVKIGGGADFDAVFSILRAPMTLSEAMDKTAAAENISATVEQIIRLID